MDTLFSHFLGIDVSAQTLHFAWQDGPQWQERCLPNDWATLQAFVAELPQLCPKPCVVLEHTGTYSHKITLALCQAGIPVSLITPLQSKAFARLKHHTTKNDRSDARLLAQYAAQQTAHLHWYQLPTTPQVHLRQMLDALAQLQAMRQQVRNRLHAYAQLPPDHQQALILSTHQSTEAHLTQQRQPLEQQLDQHYPPPQAVPLTHDRIVSVKGIGNKTARLLLTTTRGLHHFATHKQLAKFIAIAPTEKRSGSSVRGARRINKTGSSTLRKALYCATWSAVRVNLACKALYERLRAAGKPFKVALIAVANLLVRQLFAVVTAQKPFDNHYYLKFVQQT